MAVVVAAKELGRLGPRSSPYGPGAPRPADGKSLRTEPSRAREKGVNPSTARLGSSGASPTTPTTPPLRSKGIICIYNPYDATKTDTGTDTIGRG